MGLANIGRNVTLLGLKYNIYDNAKCEGDLDNYNIHMYRTLKC